VSRKFANRFCHQVLIESRRGAQRVNIIGNSLKDPGPETFPTS
jgi:hypothetical protein